MRNLFKNNVKFSWYTSPLLFAVILTILIGLFNIPVFNPYRVDVRLLPKQKEHHNIYADVNNDDYEEAITLGLVDHSNQYYVGVNGKKVFIRKNYKTSFAKSYISDINKNGTKEFFFFTNLKDSLFLSILNIPEKRIRYKYLGNKRIFNKGLRIAEFIGEVDCNNDGYNEIFFYINGKYKGNVRNIFRYDYVNDQLVKSDKFDSKIVNSYINENDGDISIVCSTWGVKKTEHYTNNDTLPYVRSGLYILDKDLKQKLNPIKYDGESKAIGCLNLKKGNKDFIVVLVDCLKISIPEFANKTLIECFDYNGNKIKSKFIEYDSYILKKGFFTIDKEGDSNLYISLKKGGILKLNSNLDVVKKIQIENIKTLILGYRGDIDGDGENEMFFHDVARKSNVIVKEDFSNPVCFVRPKPYDAIEGVYAIKKLRYSKHNSVGHSYARVNQENLCVEYGFISIFLKYYKAEDYWKVYLYAFIIFCTILFFVWFIRFLVARSMHKKYEVMNRIAELRYQNVSNQMSPHFTMNAMNSIASLIIKEDKEKAYDFLSKLAKLMKMSLLDSSRVTRTLREEIDFVKAYLDLQKLRFKDKFNYTVDMDSCVADSTVIMPFLVQTFVENAIKHGIRNLETEGLISIKTKTQSDGVFIYIEDNGVGREKAAMNKKGITSTGKGVSLAKEYIAIMNKKDNRHMSIETVDLYDNSKALGTRVIIFIDFVEEELS